MLSGCRWGGGGQLLEVGRASMFSLLWKVRLLEEKRGGVAYYMYVLGVDLIKSRIWVPYKIIAQNTPEKKKFSLNSGQNWVPTPNCITRKKMWLWHTLLIFDFFQFFQVRGRSILHIKVINKQVDIRVTELRVHVYWSYVLSIPFQQVLVIGPCGTPGQVALCLASPSSRHLAIQSGKELSKQEGEKSDTQPESSSHTSEVVAAKDLGLDYRLVTLLLSLPGLDRPIIVEIIVEMWKYCHNHFP